MLPRSHRPRHPGTAVFLILENKIATSGPPRPKSAKHQLPAALANLAGLTKAFGHFPSSAGPTGLSVPVRGLEPPSASLTRRITGQITSILVLIIIQVYGQQISVGVAEEKQSRIVEVILASIRPIQLLTGKVLGIGLLAMVQAVAMVVVFLGLGTAVGSSLIHGAAPGIVATGAIFIVIGYAFYSTAYAAAGSLVTRQSELGSVVVPVVIPLIVAYALEFTVLYANTATTFYRVLGFLPPTAPVAMPVLYAAGDAPLWQVAVSAVLLAASTVWLARIAAAIYTRSILRTGTRIRLRQALRRETETEAPAVR
jgi:ABC-2 type transport system permease protein